MPAGTSPIRRHHARYTVALAVQVRVEGSDTLRTQVTRDIGLGGVFIAMEDPPGMGAMLDLVIHFAGEANPIAAKAVVRHTIDSFLSRAIGSPPGAGVEFTELELEDERALVRLIEQWEQRELAADLDPVEVPDAGFMVGPDLPPPPPGRSRGPGPNPREFDEWSAEMKALWPPGILPYDLDAPMPPPDMEDVDIVTDIKPRPELSKAPPPPPPAPLPELEPFEESTTELYDPERHKELLGALGPPPDRLPPEESEREPAPDLLDLDSGKPDEPEIEWEGPPTKVETYLDAELTPIDEDTELTPIDDNTDELLRLEPVGAEHRPQVVAALRNEATRLQGASFEDRIGVSAGADRRAILAAHQEYCSRYERSLFGPVASTEVDRLVDEIKSLADEARDALVRRLARPPTIPPPLATATPAASSTAAGTTEALFRDGLQQLTQGHHQQAKDLLTQAHQQAPERKDIEASMHMALGALMKQYGRLEKSMAHFQRAAELDSGAHQAIEELRGFNKRPDRAGLRLLNLFRKKKAKGID
jgi:hypothetical protein